MATLEPTLSQRPDQNQNIQVVTCMGCLLLWNLVGGLALAPAVRRRKRLCVDGLPISETWAWDDG
eukprot:7106023-Alexandrium_andersonii.AAC.1